MPIRLCKIAFLLVAFPFSCFGWANRKIPITVLSGFLGSGKTTLLHHLLHNNQGLRIAVVVNDVAAVNIDSRIVQGEAAGIVELQNGCACCSKSEELLASVSELVTLSDLRGDDQGFHHIVVEMSGVADPGSVRAKFQEAIFYDMPLMERVQLDTMVTLVDCTPESFLDFLNSAKSANTEESPELFYREGEEVQREDDEVIPSSLLDILGGPSSAGDDESVADLLVSQAEIADVVVLNKVDLANDVYIQKLKEIVGAVNPKATVLQSAFGKIPISEILARAKGQGVVMSGIVDDHKDAMLAATECTDPSCEDEGHSHTHTHTSDTPDLSNTSNDADCTDASHSHSHSHDHSCDDPDCTDPSHSHSHSHDHAASTHAGIGTYVYRARRPFHPGRLASFIRMLPVTRGLGQGTTTDVAQDTPMVRTLSHVLRSKGFTWCANSDVAAMYWSQAGSNFELSLLGSWWATLDRPQWPEEAVESILQDFDDPGHDETQESFTSVGDRRQEVVFIGSGLGDPTSQALIKSALDRCLLEDSELEEYIKLRSSRQDLATRFENPFETNVKTY